MTLDKCNRIGYSSGSLKKINAVGYVRISTNEDKQKYGFLVQLGAIKEYLPSTPAFCVT